MFQDKTKNNKNNNNNHHHLNLIFHDFEFTILPQNFNDHEFKNPTFSDFFLDLYNSNNMENLYSIFSDDHNNENRLSSKDDFKEIVASNIKNTSKPLHLELNHFSNNNMLNLLTYLPKNIPFDIVRPPSNILISNSPSYFSPSAPISSLSYLPTRDDAANKKTNDYNNIISDMTNTYSSNKKSQLLDFILYDESFDEGHLDSFIFDNGFYSSLTHQSKNQINIHTDNFAEKITDYFNADAVTVLGNIFFSKGKFDISTPSGISLFVHELTHAKQLSSEVNTKFSQYRYNDLEEEAYNNENKTLRYANFLINDHFQYGIHTNTYDDEDDKFNSFLSSFKQDFHLILDSNNAIFNSNDITKPDSIKNKFSNNGYPKYVSNIRTFLTTNYNNNDQIEHNEESDDAFNNKEKSIHSEFIGNDNILSHDSSALNIHVTNNNNNNRFSSFNQRPLNTSFFSRTESLPEKTSLTPFFAKKDRTLESSSSFTNFPNIESGSTKGTDLSSHSPILETKIDIESLAKKVFDILERKIKIERARRGIW